jgi:hypothetical protein
MVVDTQVRNWAHEPKVIGSNPVHTTNISSKWSNYKGAFESSLAPD